MAAPETLTDASTAHASGLAPVNANERYIVMDVVRGFALFGVLAANMRGFNLPISVYGTPEKFFPSRVDVIAQFLLDWFVSGKAYTLFAFLFGLGFAIQMTRAQQRNPSFPWFYLRRIGALALFGLIHGLLLWNGDILVPYAMSAFLLFWFRNAKLKTVGRWIVGVWGLILLAITSLFVVIHSPLGKRIHQINVGAPPIQVDPQQVIGVYAHGHLPAIVRETALLWAGNHPPTHAHKWQWLQGALAQDVGVAMLSFTIFLLGLWVWRKGVLQSLYDLRPTLARICAWTLPLGLLAHLLVQLAKLHPHYTKVPGLDWALTLCELLGMPTLACGYATALALAFTSDAWHKKVVWLAPVGRMALTNYLMQSVVCVAFYSGIITGLYGRVGPAWDWAATFVLYGAQVAFSHWWLARFRFGPMEWLWRAMTYGKLPPMRVAP
jgi:uncharacterized protein